MAQANDLKRPVSLQTAMPPPSSSRPRRLPQLSPFGRSSPRQSLLASNRLSPHTPTRAPNGRQQKSTTFEGSTEYRPLYLVETHCQQTVPEISLPSLPSSRASSPASSTYASDNGHGVLSNQNTPEHYGSQSQGSSPVTIYEMRTFQQLSFGVAALNFEDKALVSIIEEESDDEQHGTSDDSSQPMFIFGNDNRNVDFQPCHMTASTGDTYRFVKAARKATTLDDDESLANFFATARESMQDENSEEDSFSGNEAEQPDDLDFDGLAIASGESGSEQDEEGQISHELAPGNQRERELWGKRVQDLDSRPLVLRPRFNYRDQKTPQELQQEQEEREWVEMSNADY